MNHFSILFIYFFSLIAPVKTSIDYSSVPQEIVAASEGFQTAETTANTIATASQSVSPALGSFFFVVKIGTDALLILRYLNVKYADFVYVMFENLEIEPLTPNIFLEWLQGDDFNQDDFVVQRGIFEYQQTSALYLDIFGDKISAMLCWAIVWIVLFPFKNVITKKGPPFLKKVFNFLWSFLNYTVFLSAMFENFASLVLAILLQFETPSLNHRYAVVSFILTIVSLIGVGCLIRHAFRLTNKVYKEISVGKVDLSQDAKDTLDRYQVITAEMKNTSQHAFFFFFLVIAESTLIVLILTYLQIVPLLQFIGVKLVWLIYMKIFYDVKPFAERETTMIFLIIQICFGINLWLAFPLLFLDDFETSIRNGLGYATIAVIITCSALNIIIALKKSVELAIQYIKERRNSKNEQNEDFTLTEDEGLRNESVQHQIVPFNDSKPNSARKKRVSKNLEMASLN